MLRRLARSSSRLIQNHAKDRQRFSERGTQRIDRSGTRSPVYLQGADRSRSRSRVSIVPMSGKVEKSLRAAFATNDLRRICSAIDFAVVRSGVVEVAREADVSRTTLYRAFRCRNGPALYTMLKVMRVLGFHLTVEAGRRSIFPAVNRLSQRAPSPQAKATAHSLTAAFRSGDPSAAIEALAETLSAQENVSELARKTIRWRETLY